MKTLPERIAQKVAFGSPYECWNWIGAKSRSGYGVVQFPHPEGKKRKDGTDPVAQAHRVVFHLLTGGGIDIYPSRKMGSDVLHHECNNRSCVNPNHLKLTSNRENCLLGRNSDLRTTKTSKHRGVYWDKRNQKWLAQIQVDRQMVFLGRYDTEDEAHQQYLQFLTKQEIS